MISLVGIAVADPIDDFMKSELTRTKSPSLVVGIVKDGVLVKHEVYGKSDLEKGTDAKKGDLYEIGSITKQFTAFATMMLVEEGKLKLDDPISKHLEEAPKAWEKIKIQNLVYQNSGLPDYAFEPGIGLADNFDRAKWMATMTKLPLDFEPGVAWAYSNSNYALLGWIIEKVSGSSYMTFMKERILKPLGMNNTVFSAPSFTSPHRTTGYLNLNNQFTIAPPSTASINSDGTIMSNIEDMVKWDAALRDRKLLKPKSYDLYLKAGTLNSGRWRPYAMGLNVSLPGAEPYYGHGGNSVGYSAGYACYPKAKISVIVMGNVYAFGGEPMAKQIAEMYEPSLKPIAPAIKTDPDSKRTDVLKEALAAIGNGKADDALLEPEVTASMKTRRAGMGAAGLAPFRNIEKLEFANEMSVGKDKLLTYKITTKTRDFIGTFLWSAGGKLAMASLRPDGPPKTG
ncbi:MAG: beta-lactamase family protein [Chlorobia bacterium]|nr:beta-lactamase family protein [Fimbriimonadaceae bacterium]